MVALKWSTPLGVLYDLYGNEQLPWKIYIRFQSFPKSLVTSCLGEADVESAFFHSLKQALSLRFGNAKGFMDLSKTNQEILWEGVALSRFDEYRRSIRSILDSVNNNNNNNNNNSCLVAIRMFSIAQPNKMYQMPLTVSTPQTMTLRDVLIHFGFIGTEVVVIQGIRPPLDSLIVDLCTELCAFDLFLYCVVK